MNCMRGFLREGSVEILLSKDELDCMKESSSSDYANDFNGDNHGIIYNDHPVNGSLSSPDHHRPLPRLGVQRPIRYMNGHHRTTDEKPAIKNGCCAKKQVSLSNFQRRPLSVSFDSPDEHVNCHFGYIEPRNGYHVQTVAEIHSFQTPVSPEKPASSLRNDSLTSTDEFLMRKIALQKTKLNGDTSSEMSRSILANEAWYRDQEGRTGFKPDTWRQPENEQKSIIKKIPKKNEDIERKPISKIEPNLLISDVPYKPNRESWHFPHSTGIKKHEKWINTRQVSLPTGLDNDDDEYCHCESPEERTPEFLYNAKTGSIHEEIDFSMRKNSESSTSELPALRRYYGHVWKKVAPTTIRKDDEESSISSSNPDSLDRQSSSLSLSSKNSNKSVTFAEEVEINEIETRRSHDGDSSGEEGGGQLVDEHLEELRKPLDKQNSALEMLEKQLSILQFEARREEPNINTNKPSSSSSTSSSSSLKIEIDPDLSSANSSPRHPTGRRFSASASPHVYADNASQSNNNGGVPIHANDLVTKSWSSEATTVIENQANRPVVLGATIDVDSGNASSESPTEIEPTNPLTPDTPVYENRFREDLRLQYSDDDLERKTSFGSSPPPGLTLSQWEEMIRSIYLEQTSSEAMKNNLNKPIGLSQRSLYPEDIYGPDIYQQILGEKESPESLTTIINLETPVATRKLIDSANSDVVRSASGYFYLQKSLEAHNKPISKITISEQCRVKEPRKPTTLHMYPKTPSADNLTLGSPTLLSPTTNFTSCASIEQSFYDNVQPESIVRSGSIESTTPYVKKIAVLAERVPTQQPIVVKRTIQNNIFPTSPENLLKSKFIAKYGKSPTKSVPPVVSPELLSEDDQLRKDPRMVTRKVSHDSLLSTDSRESVISATSFQAENKVRRYFNY